MKGKYTLAIYGIKDRNNMDYPSYTHDHNLCLMKDGEIIKYLQLERYTNRKYDNRLDLFLEELIADKILELPEDFDLVSVNSFIGNSFITKSGKLRFESNISKTLSNDLEDATAYYQYEERKGKEINAYNCSQELAHIATCLPFYGEFKENSLLIHFDGASSLSNFSVFLFKAKKIELLEYNWDLKYIANFFNNNALTFSIIGAKTVEHCSVPGKLMGFSSLGQHNEKIEYWLEYNSYFQDYWHREDEILTSIYKEFGHKFEEINNEISFFQDVAATFQHIFEEVLLKKIKGLQRNTNVDFLYYSGGCALNIVANTRIINECNFKNVFIPPCCNDSGLSIGAAAFLEWKKGNDIKIHTPYLNNLGIEQFNEEVLDDEVIKVANILLKGGIIGVCNGDGEVGPRALGNRSLIALANSKKIARKISMGVKNREWYRPVAPIMLEKIVTKITRQKLHHLSKYMLLDFSINPEFHKDLEGVIHFNNTARIQILKNENENPFMFKLLDFLYKKHNILALINTSFNKQGEPIIYDSKSAKASAKTINISGVVLNNILTVF